MSVTTSNGRYTASNTIFFEVLDLTRIRATFQYTPVGSTYCANSTLSTSSDGSLISLPPPVLSPQSFSILFYPFGWPVGTQSTFTLTSIQVLRDGVTTSLTPPIKTSTGSFCYLSGCQSTPKQGCSSSLDWVAFANADMTTIGVSFNSTNPALKPLNAIAQFKVVVPQLICNETWTTTPIGTASMDSTDSSSAILTWSFANAAIYPICTCKVIHIWWSAYNTSNLILMAELPCNITTFTVSNSTQRGINVYWQIRETPNNIDNPSDTSETSSPVYTLCYPALISPPTLVFPDGQFIPANSVMNFKWTNNASWSQSCNSNKHLMLAVSCDQGRRNFIIPDPTSNTFNIDPSSFRTGETCSWKMIAVDDGGSVVSDSKNFSFCTCASCDPSSGLCHCSPGFEPVPQSTTVGGGCVECGSGSFSKNGTKCESCGKGSGGIQCAVCDKVTSQCKGCSSSNFTLDEKSDVCVLRISLTLNVSMPNNSSSINATELEKEIATVLGISTTQVRVELISKDNQGMVVVIVSIVTSTSEVSSLLLSKQDPNNQLLNTAVSVSIITTDRSAQTSSSGGEKDGLSTGAIIGIVVGSAAAVSCIAIGALMIVIVVVKRQHTTKNDCALSGMPMDEVKTGSSWPTHSHQKDVSPIYTEQLAQFPNEQINTAPLP